MDRIGSSVEADSLLSGSRFREKGGLRGAGREGGTVGKGVMPRMKSSKSTEST